MLKPPIDELIENTGNRYALCVIASRRAREIVDLETHTDDETLKPITIAIDEIMNDELEVTIPTPPLDRI